MATKQKTTDYILEQVESAGKVSSRRMFGEYALYCDNKVFALICDDQLYIKPTKAGEEFIGTPELGTPFPGAKSWFLIDGDKWEDSDWLSDLVRVSLPEIPVNKPKKKAVKNK